MLVGGWDSLLSSEESSKETPQQAGAPGLRPIWGPFKAPDTGGHGSPPI